MSATAPAPFIVAGPTAVGKSALAVALAEACDGEIVNADAFQIYQGLDILTAKPAPELLHRVPHHLIGEVPLTDSFDVGQYLRRAQERIATIRGRNRVPIVVGGTGLYLRALTHGLADLPPADAELRARLEALPSSALINQLAVLDPESHARIDLQNRRRLIRALEVCELAGRPFSSFRQEWNAPSVVVQGVILSRPREELHGRIDRRTDAMFAAGVIDEVRHAGPIGPTARQVLGYREIAAFLAGTMPRDACIASIQQATRQYAKRQRTWFTRDRQMERVELAGDEIPPSLIAAWARQAISSGPP